jgi:hypothetical protein
MSQGPSSSGRARSPDKGRGALETTNVPAAADHGGLCSRLRDCRHQAVPLGAGQSPVRPSLPRRGSALAGCLPEVRDRGSTMGRLVRPDPRRFRPHLGLLVRRRCRWRETEMVAQAAPGPSAPLLSLGCFVSRANWSLRRQVPDDRAVAVVLAGVAEIGGLRGSPGGPAADETVRAVAEWVLAAPGPADSAVLMGGGEFAILCGGVRESSETDTIIRRARDAMAWHFEVGGAPVPVATATGMAMASSPRTPRGAAGRGWSRDACGQAVGCGPDDGTGPGWPGCGGRSGAGSGSPPWQYPGSRGRLCDIFPSRGCLPGACRGCGPPAVRGRDGT